MPTTHPAILLLALTASVQASFLSSIFFGQDNLEPVRQAIRRTEQFRSEVDGWYKHNATQQANFTVADDPKDLYTLLPATYAERSLVAPDGSYYSDIEGYYKGKWEGWDFSTQANRSLAIDSKLNRTVADHLGRDPKKQNATYVAGVNEQKLRWDRGRFDWLGTGKIDLHLKEEHLTEGNVSLVTGSLSFQPTTGSASEESVDFSLEGLHFIPTGSIFLDAMGDDNPSDTDVRTTLGLIPHGNSETMNATIAAIDKAFQLRIDWLKSIIASGSYDSGDVSGTPAPVKHNCSLHIYGQLKSAGPHDSVQPLLTLLESETRHSTGISTITPPPLELSLLVYSPDCQFVTQSTSVHGLLQTRLWNKAVHYAILYFVVLFVQTRVLIFQMEVTSTPSGLTKVAHQTWLLQSILDAYACIVHLSVGVAVEEMAKDTVLPLIACAFMSGICFLAFGYRYTVTIYQTQMDASPSTSPAPAPVPATTPAVAPQQASAGSMEGETIASDHEEDNASTPNNANAARTSVLQTTVATISAADAETATPEELAARRRGASIAAVALFLIFVAFFPIETVLLALPMLYSFWVPQIYRNVVRGTRRAVLKRTIVVTTLCRLFVPLYVLGCPDNVLLVDPSRWAWVLGGWVGLQAAALMLQDVFGPHWFMRKSWIPEATKGIGWEYHPELNKGGDEEDGVEGDGGYPDCAICLTAIESKRAKRRSRRRERGRQASEAKGWFGFGTSHDGYDRIADAEDYEVADQDTPYSATKGRSPSWDPPGAHQAPSTSTTRRLRRGLAKLISRALEWKEGFGAANRLRRRRMDVMVAPCQHAFHTECLERWLEIKSECPSCRALLPSV